MFCFDPNHANAFRFPFTFGCMESSQGLFVTQLADGIIGMDKGSASFWRQARNAGVFPDPVFSLCFSRQPTATHNGTESGAISLGGYDTRIHQTSLFYARSQDHGIHRQQFFGVHIRKLYLQRGQSTSAVSVDTNTNTNTGASSTSLPTGIVQVHVDEAALNTGGAIVDSGTTDTLFRHGISSEFRKVFLEITGKPYFGTHPVRLSQQELMELPTILLQLASDKDANTHLKGSNRSSQAPTVHTGYPALAAKVDPAHPDDILVAIPPSHYMEWDRKTDTYTARFYDNELHGGTVIGANTMMGHDVVFDAENGRIGWARSECNYTKLLHDTGLPDDLFATGGVQSKKIEVVEGSSGGYTQSVGLVVLVVFVTVALLTLRSLSSRNQQGDANLVGDESTTLVRSDAIDLDCVDNEDGIELQPLT